MFQQYNVLCSSGVLILSVCISRTISNINHFHLYIAPCIVQAKLFFFFFRPFSYSFSIHRLIKTFSKFHHWFSFLFRSVLNLWSLLSSLFSHIILKHLYRVFLSINVSFILLPDLLFVTTPRFSHLFFLSFSISFSLGLHLRAREFILFPTAAIPRDRTGWWFQRWMMIPQASFQCRRQVRKSH